MTPLDMEQEILDAPLTLHVSKPGFQAKSIQINPKAGSILQVQVNLPNEQYYIVSLDSKRYQVAEETFSTLDGSKRYVEQSDFRRISGIITPFRSKVYSDGVLMHEQVLQSVEVNQGVMPWMFKRPQ